MRIPRLLLAALMIVPAAPAVAQDAPATSDDSDQIIVIGRAERERIVRDFVYGLVPPTGGTDPVARLEGEYVCPGVVGLSDARNGEITARMRLVAREAGMPLGPDDCRPNAIVIFTRDKEEMAKALQRKYPVLFQDGTGIEQRIPKEDGPVYAWQIERRLDREGRIVAYNADAGYYMTSSPVGASRLRAANRPVFVGAVVVIEVDALVGLTPVQIADYAAMRAYAQVDPKRIAKAGAPTILGALDAPDGAPVPVTLTQWDMAYLRALYAIEPYNHGQRQRRDIRSRVLDEIDPQASED